MRADFWCWGRGERVHYVCALVGERFPFSDNVIIRLEIAASAVKFFFWWCRENVTFPPEMNFRLGQNIFHFQFFFFFLGGGGGIWFFWWRPSASFQSVPLIAVNLEKNGIPLPFWWMTTTNTKRHQRRDSCEIFFSLLFQFFNSFRCSPDRYFLPTKRKKKKKKGKSATRFVIVIEWKRNRLRQKAHGLNRADWMQVDRFD